MRIFLTKLPPCLPLAAWIRKNPGRKCNPVQDVAVGRSRTQGDVVWAAASVPWSPRGLEGRQRRRQRRARQQPRPIPGMGRIPGLSVGPGPLS